ncbi:hypothetical protein [Pseudoalteromonas sp. Of11M-6]|uniref:hypothetical protein n=1 Tax=Pseudoalteromonas sp. Of11M-6 TaxID=2917754 RepID=UPI001EF7073C|nr:hypothetical protein [Pseudoalteromonas sp. Of11M-6]MCG7556106.1 hypothetical protein [Pseudoalteromonas sp. Of11M-6]
MLASEVITILNGLSYTIEYGLLLLFQSEIPHYIVADSRLVMNSQAISPTLKGLISMDPRWRNFGHFYFFE